MRAHSDANAPGGGVAWDHHAAPVQHQMGGAFMPGGINRPGNADVHWFASNQLVVRPGAYVDAPAESATIANGTWQTNPGNLPRARIDKENSMKLQIRSHGSLRLFGNYMNLPPNLGGLRAEDYFEQNWLRDVSASFRINTVEASVIPAASYSGVGISLVPPFFSRLCLSFCLSCVSCFG